MEIRAIRDGEQAECLELWDTVFGDDPAYFKRYFYGDADWLPYYTQVALVDGKIVSAAHVVKRTVACGEMRLTMGGLSNVATLPEFRGRGLNRQCVERLIAVMEADAMDFSLLFTGVNAYYAKMGYADLPRPDAVYVIRPDFVPTPTDYTIRTVCAEDLPAVFACYDSYNAVRPIAVQRSEAYWRDWIGVAANKGFDGTFLIVADAKGRLVGYEQVEEWFPNVEKKPDAQGILTEFAIRLDLSENEKKNAAFALLQEITARFHSDGCDRIYTAAPFDVSIEGETARLFSERIDSVESDGMARLLHRENLFRGLSMAWNERWNTAGNPQGIVTFETPYGLTQLNATGAFLKIGPTDSAEAIISQSDFFGLLFGFGRLEALAKSGAASELLAALFPPQSPVYWSADGF